MNIVIKSNLVIENPILGKLLMKQIVTSGSLIKSVLGNIVGTQTDASLGGVSATWLGAAVMEYVSTGIANSTNATANTAYLNHSEIKNFNVAFDVVECGDGDLIVDLRRHLTSDNYCVRVKLGNGTISCVSRAGSESVIISTKTLTVGDKVEVSLIDNDIKLKVNSKVYTGTIAEAQQGLLDRSGLLALSKGSTASKTGRIVIKNLIVSELS